MANLSLDNGSTPPPGGKLHKKDKDKKDKDKKDKEKKYRFFK
jgi:syntaxin-binding protein 1